MKQLTTYIVEKLKINKDSNKYHYHPKDRDELKSLIEKLIKERGNEADLNDIDISKITDMSWIFSGGATGIASEFNGDISFWDVSNVTNMHSMFCNSKFNQDISSWDVSNVTNMGQMFCNSKFNQDISAWDVSNVTDMINMFRNSDFNQDISSWDVSNVKDMGSMFR